MQTEQPIVSAEDIKALKEAQSYVLLFFRPDGAEGPVWGMRIGAQVRLDAPDALKRLHRISNSGVWTRTYADEHTVDFVRVIPAWEKFCTIERYNDDSRDHSEVKEAVWLDSGYSHLRHHVRTALDFIRAGDSIACHFVGSNNSPVDNRVSHHRDECYLRVCRKDKVYEFLLGVYVGPDNTARIVK